MAGTSRPVGPPSERVAANIRRIRRERELTTAALSQRLAAIGHPIADTGITKTEKGTRRVDVDDLVAFALVLGVTPNTLLMPQPDGLGPWGPHYLTPAVRGSDEDLWLWAQGERPIRVPAPDNGMSWVGDGPNPAAEFPVRNRPYLTAVHAPLEARLPDPRFRDITVAVGRAMRGGATGVRVRRAVELTIALPSVMSREQISRWLEDDPEGEGP
jgi:transcriptional regulator with XRE-family HTH domain